MMPMTAEAILLSGADLSHRLWGPLRIKDVVDLSLIRSGECPLLNAHSLCNQPLGHVASAWTDRGAVKAVLRFDNTLAGHRAFDRARRGETLGISCGVEFADFCCEDRQGREVEIDPDDVDSAVRNPNLVLVSKRTQILEVSLVPIPSDPGAHITRVFGGDMISVQRRMMARHRDMLADRCNIKHRPPSDPDDDYEENPARKGLIQFTEPGRII